MNFNHPICNNYCCPCVDYKNPNWDKVKKLQSIGRLEESIWMIQDIVGYENAIQIMNNCSSIKDSQIKKTYLHYLIRSTVVVKSDSSSFFLDTEVLPPTKPVQKKSTEVSLNLPNKEKIQAYKEFIMCATMGK